MEYVLSGVNGQFIHAKCMQNRNLNLLELLVRNLKASKVFSLALLIARGANDRERCEITQGD